MIKMIEIDLREMIAQAKEQARHERAFDLLAEFWYEFVLEPLGW